MRADPFIAPIDASIEKALAYLESAINKDDGSYGAMVPDKETGKDKYVPDVGITGLVVLAVAQSTFAEREMPKEYFQKALKYILDNVQENGSICNKGQGLENYRTSIGIMALQAVDAAKYADTIKKAQDFVKSLQFGADKDNPGYEGGIGYGGSFVRPDLSNTQMAIEALRDSGVPADDEVVQKTVKFLQRCQNLTNTNDYDQTQADVTPLNDGGARYSPYESKAVSTTPDGKKALNSYGSMTYAFLKSMIYAGVKRDDPRVRAAFQWIKANYDLDRNPGFSVAEQKDADKQGLFYYYHTMSKALLVFGDHVITTPDGKLHNWAIELSQKLISLQAEDGSWTNSFEERWFEGNPSLVTAYSIAILNNCRKDLQNQDEFIKTTPAKIAEIEKQVQDVMDKVAKGEITKEEGDKQIAEMQQIIASFKNGLADLQKTREQQVNNEKEQHQQP
jgi:squalene-hopene/tetraprenyl-beta-curcumene cyclase